MVDHINQKLDGWLANKEAANSLCALKRGRKGNKIYFIAQFE